MRYFAAYDETGNLVAIPESQVRFHKFWEAASVFVQLPFMVYLGTRKELPGWARAGAWIAAGAIVYVDGSLLLKWKAMDRAP
jgi:hypothetical protein